MAKFELEHQQGNEPEHGDTTVEALGMGVEPIPRKLALGNQGGLKHGRDPENNTVWSGRSHSRES